jgi:hypothetical protein
MTRGADGTLLRAGLGGSASTPSLAGGQPRGPSARRFSFHNPLQLFGAPPETAASEGGMEADARPKIYVMGPLVRN